MRYLILTSNFSSPHSSLSNIKFEKLTPHAFLLCFCALIFSKILIFLQKKQKKFLWKAFLAKKLQQFEIFFKKRLEFSLNSLNKKSFIENWGKLRNEFPPQPHYKIEGPHFIPHIEKCEDPHLKTHKKSEVRSELRSSPHLSQWSVIN